jgi:hypothetical protein
MCLNLLLRSALGQLPWCSIDYSYAVYIAMFMLAPRIDTELHLSGAIQALPSYTPHCCTVIATVSISC